MGATWNTELVRTAGRITGDEGRALHNLGVQRNRGASTEARGLNCFAPNVNIFRDPRVRAHWWRASGAPSHSSA